MYSPISFKMARFPKGKFPRLSFFYRTAMIRGTLIREFRSRIPRESRG